MLKKKILKVLVCLGILFSLTTVAFASGGFTSTYSITGTGGRPGVLYGASRFNLSHNSMSVDITISNVRHTAGNLYIILQRDRGLLGFGSVGSSASFSASNPTRTLTAGNSGTYRLRLWTQNATGTNSGSISVSSRR
ncbi:MAG: hypothetical protein FWE07_05490 [Turicibacter sp.]|nr:hypothetical protein [Turicibacter sp.]